MVDSYGSYRQNLSGMLARHSKQDQFFFGCWCVQALYGSTFDDLPAKVTRSEKGTIRDAWKFLWTQHSAFPACDEKELHQLSASVNDIVEKEFDQQISDEYNTMCLLTAQLLVLAFLEEKDVELIVDVAEVLIQSLEDRMLNVLGQDTSALFDHPLIAHELRIQDQLVQRFTDGPPLTIEDYCVFRPQFREPAPQVR